MKAALTYLFTCTLFLTVCTETFIIHQKLKEVQSLKAQIEVNKAGALELVDQIERYAGQNDALAERTNKCENFIFHRGEWFIYGFNKHTKEDEIANGKGTS